MKILLLVCILFGLLSVNAAADESNQMRRTKVPVFLNHFFTVLDLETYQAIAASEFMTREFAPNEYRKTVRGDLSYAGIYFYGLNTYFEFFDEQSRGPGSLGFSMLAYGVDEPGALAALSSELADTYPLSTRPVSRGYENKQIRWFDQANAVNAKGSPRIGYGAWIMEYDPTFLAVWKPGKSKGEGVSRAAILQRYRSVLDDAPAKPYFEDIVGLTFALDPVSLKDAIDLARAAGFRENHERDTYIFTSPDFELQLQPVGDRGRGVKQMTLRVNRQPDQTVLQLGKSTLVFGDDNLARWTF